MPKNAPLISINELYRIVSNKSETTFITPKTKKTETEFYSKHLNSILSTEKSKGTDIEKLYQNSLDAREESGFIIGFKVALQLLTQSKII